jgi:hypothetical protein
VLLNLLNLIDYDVIGLMVMFRENINIAEHSINSQLYNSMVLALLVTSHLTICISGSNFAVLFC